VAAGAVAFEIKGLNMTGLNNGSDIGSHEGVEGRADVRVVSPVAHASELGVRDARNGAGVAPVVSEDTALLGLIERAARDQTVDIDKMERLFQMRERMEQRRAEQAYNAAFAAAQAAMVPVAKSKHNKQTNSDYADIAALAEIITPIYTKHGFGISFGQKPAPDGFIGVVADVTHGAGFSKRYEFDIPADGVGIKGNANMTRIHAMGSSFTYGRRYAKLMIWDIATKDNDGNAASSSVITDAQLKELSKLITDSKADLDWILGRYEIPDLQYMTAAQFKEAKAGLMARLRKTQ
jgi:hypothetical protein